MAQDLDNVSNGIPPTDSRRGFLAVGGSSPPLILIVFVVLFILVIILVIRISLSFLLLLPSWNLTRPWETCQGWRKNPACWPDASPSWTIGSPSTPISFRGCTGEKGWDPGVDLGIFTPSTAVTSDSPVVLWAVVRPSKSTKGLIFRLGYVDHMTLNILFV